MNFQHEAKVTRSIRVLYQIFLSTGMMTMVFFAGVVLAGANCKGGSVTPANAAATEDAIAPAVSAVATAGCDVLQAVDESGTLQEICALLPEILAVAAAIIPLVVMLADGKTDGGEACKLLPHTKVCATNAQRLKAIRQIRIWREDGGTSLLMKK